MFLIKHRGKIEFIVTVMIIIISNIITFFISKKNIRYRTKNDNLKLIKSKLDETTKKLTSVEKDDESNAAMLATLKKEKNELKQSLELAKKVSTENIFFSADKSMKTLFKTSISVQKMHDFVKSPHITAGTSIKTQYISRNGKFVWFFNSCSKDDLKDVEHGEHIASMWNLVMLDHSNADEAQGIINSGNNIKIANAIKSGQLIVISYRMADTSWGYRFFGSHKNGSWSGLKWTKYPNNGEFSANIGQICVDGGEFKCKK